MVEPLDPISVEQRHIDFVAEHTPRFMQHLGSQIAHILARFERDLPRAHQPRSGEMREAVAREQAKREAFERATGVEIDGPCPICNGIEGCDHSLGERIRAALSPTVTVPQDAEGEREEAYDKGHTDGVNDALDLCTDYQNKLVAALEQYRNDMRYPPEPDSRDRRIAMIEKLLVENPDALTPAKGGA